MQILNTSHFTNALAASSKPNVRIHALLETTTIIQRQNCILSFKVNRNSIAFTFCSGAIRPSAAWISLDGRLNSSQEVETSYVLLEKQVFVAVQLASKRGVPERFEFGCLEQIKKDLLVL